jgi:hypothetical protein
VFLQKLFGRKSRVPAQSQNPDRAMIEPYSEKSGMVNGKHYTQYTEDIKEFKRQGKNEEAISLLLALVDATENEFKAKGPEWCMAPWYFEQLSIIYRKEKRYQDEINIINRYINIVGETGSGYASLCKRLEKAQALLHKLY